MFFVGEGIFGKYIQYTIHSDKMQLLKIFHSDKINIAKTVFFSVASSNSSQFYF